MPEQEKVQAVAVPIEDVREAVKMFSTLESGLPASRDRARRLRRRLAELLDGRRSP